MQMQCSQALLGRRRNRLAACVATLLGLASPAVFANSVFVTNCNDNGTGSLRNAVTAAASGDIVDMSGLTSGSPGCSASTITLKTGEILISQSSLTIKGPGMTNLTVTGKYGTFPNDTIEPARLFTHIGTGTLTLEYFSMSKGYETTTNTEAVGGCVYSSANVILISTGLYECEAHSSGGGAGGGAIYAKGNLIMKYSVVADNSAQSLSGTISYGGGVFAGDGINLKYSTISGNRAVAISGTADGFGGGAFVVGNGAIHSSTISDNTSDSVVGGIAIEAGSASTQSIVSSTITGNTASGGEVGGAYFKGDTVKVYNSTVAFNDAADTQGGDFGAGLALEGAITLQSNLIANNTYGSPAVDDDLSINTATAVGGGNNLVRTSSASLPADTITGKCPILGQLRFNGGFTQTLALQSKSPGVDQGNNAFGAKEDQRGNPKAVSPYPYPRVSGTAADTGAYEINQSDIIFTSNFEGCI